jgi:NAD(P)H-flavin reductase
MADVTVAADPLVPERVAVRRSLRETSDTWTLELEPIDRNGFRFLPGQFNMVYAFGAGEVPISISGDATRPELLVHTVRAVGAATKAICSVDAGDVLGVRGPYGSSWPVDQAAGGDAVVIAGGIGLAPLRPIVYELIANRDRFNRAVLLYGGRTPDQLLYMGELERWRGAGIDVQLTVDFAEADWAGDVGVVPELIERVAFEAEKTSAFVCGPEVMIEASCQVLLAAGVPSDRIHLSLERNMKCAVGHCGHCQFGPEFLCRNGPVFDRDRIRDLLRIREL